MSESKDQQSAAYYAISAKTLRGLADYLSRRPYGEVAPLMAGLFESEPVEITGRKDEDDTASVPSDTAAAADSVDQQQPSEGPA